jgi:hypothetical protein
MLRAPRLGEAQVIIVKQMAPMPGLVYQAEPHVAAVAESRRARLVSLFAWGGPLGRRLYLTKLDECPNLRTR